MINKIDYFIMMGKCSVLERPHTHRHTHKYIYICDAHTCTRGACRVMVIIVENGHKNPSSNRL